MNNGAFGEHFPYTNFHDLNLDWILKVVKDFEDHYTQIQEAIDAGILQLNEATVQHLQEMADEYTRLSGLLDDQHTQISAALTAEEQTIINQITIEMRTALQDALNNLDDKAEETIASIPADYTTLSQTVANIQQMLGVSTSGAVDLSTYLERSDYVFNHATRSWLALSGYNTYRIPIHNSGEFLFISTTNSIPFWEGLSSTYILGMSMMSTEPTTYYQIGPAIANNWLGGYVDESSNKYYGDAIVIGADNKTDFARICIKQTQLPFTYIYKNSKLNPSTLYINKYETYIDLNSDDIIKTALYKDNDGYFRALPITNTSPLKVGIIQLKQGDEINITALATDVSYYGTLETAPQNVIQLTNPDYIIPANGILYVFMNSTNHVYLDPVNSIRLSAKHIVGLQQEQILYGKTITFFGDSITHDWTWEPHILNDVGGIGVNCGIGSTPISGTDTNAFWQTARLNQVKLSNPDIVVILGGANDIILNPIIGTDADLISKDTNTFIGAYSYIIDNLLNWKPSLKIIILSTTYAHNDGADYSQTVTYGDYANACEKVAKYYKLPYVDLYNESGFNSYTMGNGVYAIYSADAIHPNEAGSKIIASMVTAKIKEIFS